MVFECVGYRVGPWPSLNSTTTSFVGTDSLRNDWYEAKIEIYTVDRDISAVCGFEGTYSDPSTLRPMARSDRNWAHSPDFGRGAMVDFEKRLGRAQARRRPGYLRVKAATLLAISDSRATKIALDLLHRVVDGYTDFLEVPRSHELLGDAYRESGELKAAEAHLRLAIAGADDNRNGLGLPELSLAEVLLEQDRFEDAQQALNDVQSLRRGMIWNAQLYRFAVASARCALHSGTDAASWAQAALGLANVEAPQLPRHPTVGLVVSIPRTLKEMRKIVRTA